MKLYSSINATLHVQSFGSAFLMVVKGEEKEIEKLFNALYNFGAMAPRSNRNKQDFTAEPFEIKYTNHTHTCAVFWSSPKQMLNFFRNQFFFRHADEFANRRANGWKRANYGPNLENHKPFQTAMQTFAVEQLKELQKSSAITLEPWQKATLDQVYAEGHISAERPDDDFLAAAWKEGFKVRHGETTQKGFNEAARDYTNERSYKSQVCGK